MAIHVALHHRTTYRYDRLIELGPQLIRLKPAPHARTPILGYTLKVQPTDHYINWQQDPFGNFLARLVFTEKTRELNVEVDLLADMTVINPFDFFVEASAEAFPFKYEPWLRQELLPYLNPERAPATSKMRALINDTPKKADRTIDWLVEVNRRIQSMVGYTIRMEPGVQTPEQTLKKASGSCRDSAWLLVNLLRHHGLAARFVSGYLIQLAADTKSLDGPSGPEADFTDLHAWAEAFLPGAGWVGLDPTSGLLTGEGHIPLAATPNPSSAAPITGSLEACETRFDFDMTLTRIHEDPRVTKPYTDGQWRKIEALGHAIDRRIDEDDIRLTMGGEPTFVSIDDMDGAEWNVAAVGPHKRRLSNELVRRLGDRFAPGALFHFGQGKWYPGEPLPRWAFGCYWRKDGEPVWHDRSLVADADRDYGFGVEEARAFSQYLAATVGVDPAFVIPAYEDAMYYAWKENRLPHNVTAGDSKTRDELERRRLARVFERGLDTPRGFVMPLQQPWWQARGAGPRWATGFWPVRSDQMFLLPGDSPMGLRLPLEGLSYIPEGQLPVPMPMDPTAPTPPLPEPLMRRMRDRLKPAARSQARTHARALAGVGAPGADHESDTATDADEWIGLPGRESFDIGNGKGNGFNRGRNRHAPHAHPRHPDHPGEGDGAGFGDTDDLEPPRLFDEPALIAEAPYIVRTALCVEPRDGRLHVFMPPVDNLEDYLDLVGAVEATAAALGMPVLVEGYLPPTDARLNVLKVTPDPGVIEVNIHPAASWDELTHTTTALYDEARLTRLGTEKFDLDGKHTGTGGGNHFVLGGATPLDSPFLRKPELLASVITYWLNHPALSYLFSSRFIGPTSQAPRVDEGRADALYELDLALKTIESEQGCDAPPWLVDRVFRHLLTDLTGNTHRAEICIDKLYSPDASSGRLGLVELRGFEMPPHPRMSLTQQLLIRALVAHLWRHPCRLDPVAWGTTLHDRFMLPHFLHDDLVDILDDLRADGMDLDPAWFAPHFEFRFPKIGVLDCRGVHVELRHAIEPWYVLGEEPAGGGTVRGVDSSVERLQVKVDGLTESRHAVTCNGRRVPLHPTGVEGQFVAGVRYRAWQPPSCLHPTIPIHTPLVFDLVDTWQHRSLGGATYHVSNPTGRNPETFPVNAFEAEARRAARFFAAGHTPGSIRPIKEADNPRFPMTLDLRRPPIAN